MNYEIYIALRADKSFHTIIIKKKIGEFTYLLAIGYAGGRVYEEFFAKLMYDVGHNIAGQFSKSIGSGEWETKLITLKFNDETEWFDAETEDLFQIMTPEDEEIQNNLISELKTYIFYGYDEQNGIEYEFPEPKVIDTSIFTEYNDSPGRFYNTKWGDEWLEITNSNIWGLSTRFPHVIDFYL